MAIPFVDELRTWHENYVAQGGRRSVRVELHESLQEPKSGAWIMAEGPSAVGQLTLWLTGECDTQAFGSPTVGEPHIILQRSRVLTSPAAVATVADDLVDHVADYSGT